MEIAAIPVKELLLLLFLFAIAPGIPMLAEAPCTSHLAVVLSHLSSWQLHPHHVQTRFKKKKMLQKFILGPQGALTYVGGDFQQRFQEFWVPSVCGVNSALLGFVGKVGIQGRAIMQEQRSRLQGQCDKQIARTGKENSLWIKTRE